MTQYSNTTEIDDRIEEIIDELQEKYEDENLEDITLLKTILDSDDEVEIEELIMLLEFKNEVDSYSTWNYATIVHEDDIDSYIRDIIDSDLPNLPSYVVIDYESSIENIKPNYIVIEMSSETYYIV